MGAERTKRTAVGAEAVTERWEGPGVTEGFGLHLENDQKPLKHLDTEFVIAALTSSGEWVGVGGSGRKEPR